MTVHRLSTYVRLALLAAAAGTMTACAPTRGYYEPEPYYASPGGYYGAYDDYWYYPAIGCYYDPRVRMYMYYEHDHWVRAHTLPPHYRPYLGSHVTIRSAKDRPYEDHFRHRERYAPERYTSERYKKTPPDYKRDDVWIGAPRQPIPQRDRDGRRQDSDDRNRNGKDPARFRDPDRSTVPFRPQDTERAREIRKEAAQDSNRERDVRRTHDQSRGSVPGQQQYRERTVQQPPPQTSPPVVPGEIRGQVPGRREPPASVAPVKQQDKARARETRKEESKYRESDVRRDDARNTNDASSQKPPPGPEDHYEDYR